MGNKRFLVFTLILVGIAGVILVWWTQTVPQKEWTNTELGPPTQPSPQGPIARASPQERQLPGGPYQSSDPRWAEVMARDKMDRAWEWKMPIDFYGRVVDENDRPVQSARVYAQWSDLSANGASGEETSTDSQGSFAITGKTGRGITVRTAKQGYYTPTRQQISFDYAAFWEANYYRPDPANPVIFHLRRKGAGETLSAGEAQPPVSADGTPVRVDLLSGARVSPNGQVEIAAMTNTEKYPPRVFDWEASIAVPDGGLIEHDLEFPFEAPEQGYVAKVEFKMAASAPDWRRTLEKTYFIRFGNPPRYGRIHLRLNGASQKVFLSYAVNPSGSRNLEATTDEQFSTP